MLGGRWMEWQSSWRTERWEDSSIYQPLIGQSVLKAFQGIRLNHGTKLTRISPIILAWLGSMWCNPNILRISRPANACSVKPHGLWASPRQPVCTQGIYSVSKLVHSMNMVHRVHDMYIVATQGNSTVCLYIVCTQYAQGIDMVCT